MCTKFGIQGYPTIKYGEPGDLKDYQGGRDFDTLKKSPRRTWGHMRSGEHWTFVARR